MLGWDLDTIAHLLRLPSTLWGKVVTDLQAIPRKALTTSLHKWCKLLGMLRSITPAVAESRGMFTRAQHSLKQAAGRHFQLTMEVHNNLEAWRELVRSLTNRPTHFHEIEPFAPSWIVTTDALGSGMGGIC